MSFLRRPLMFLMLAATLAAAPAASAQPDPRQQDEFVPMSEVPPEEQLPAAPLVMVAYGAVWVAVFGYVLSVARRLERVQGELQRLEADVQRGSRV